MPPSSPRLPRSLSSLRRLASLVAVAAALAAPAANAFQPLASEHLALTEVEWQPDASAVVLFERAALHFRQYPGEPSSWIEVEVRIKILTEAGLEQAEVAVVHGKERRLSDLAARTVQPDGTVVEVGKDAVFEERRSRSSKLFVTKIAFPAVRVGSILDYRYRLSWDDFFSLDPWLFHGHLPKLRSEIEYSIPPNLSVRTWSVRSGPQEILNETRKVPPDRTSLRVWMENLHALPEEPWSFPMEDLSSRILLYPDAVYVSGTRIDLLSSWENVVELVEEQSYRDFRKSRKVKKAARDLAEGLSGAALVDRLHRHVRDEIRTEAGYGIWPRAEDAEDVLEAGRGSPAGKALLLVALLDENDVRAHPVWAAHREDGRVVEELPNPTAFTTVLVRADVDGRTTFLDPADPTLPFGRLGPGYEGTTALIADPKSTEVVRLPRLPAAAHRRTADLDLTIGDDGGWSGTGTLELTGNAAWFRILADRSDEDTHTVWKERLTDDFGCDVSDLTVEEDIESAVVRVAFRLTQREEDVLGDENAWSPARPYATENPFVLPPEERRTPVQLDFPFQDLVETTLRWPEGWELESAPRALLHRGPVGEFELRVERGDDGRSATISRRFVRTETDIIGRDAYAALRELTATAARSDDETLVLFAP